MFNQIIAKINVAVQPRTKKTFLSVSEYGSSGPPLPIPMVPPLVGCPIQKIPTPQYHAASTPTFSIHIESIDVTSIIHGIINFDIQQKKENDQ